MNISFELNLEEDELDLFKSILGCESDQLNQQIAKIASASFEEYLRMILGQKVFTRGQDILEYRLLVLVKHYFDERIPDEQDISNLFQATASGSRAITRAIMSKYQYDLKDAIQNTLHDLVESIEKKDGTFKLSVYNQFFKDELNRTLGNIDPALPRIEREKETVSRYIVKESSYNRLCEYYSVEPKE